MILVRRLDAGEAEARIDELAAVLVDCVRGGASVSFLQDLSEDEARAFFRDAVGEAKRGGRAILVAEEGGRIVGTAQTIFVATPNQPHRAEIAKMLVHRRARKKGVGARLLAAAEAAAIERSRWLLVLDTVPGTPAERLYARGGWKRVGIIPNYALMPDGALCDTMVFCKDLRAEA